MATFSLDAAVEPTYLDYIDIAAGYGILSVPVDGLLPGDLVQTLTLVATLAESGTEVFSKAIDQSQRSDGFFEWVTSASVDGHFTILASDVAALNDAAEDVQYSVSAIVTRSETDYTREVQGGAMAARPLVPTPPMLVNSITITGGPVSGAPGETDALAAVTRDGYGNIITGQTVVWASTNDSIAEVDQSGTVSFITPGIVTISATCQGLTATTTATTSTAPVSANVGDILVWDGSLWSPVAPTANRIQPGTFSGSSVQAYGFSGPLNVGGLLTAATGAVVTSGGLTVSAGTTAVQALTATTGLFSSTLQALSFVGALASTLTFGAHLSGGSYNNSAAVSVATDATSANTVGTIVARDGSGNFTAGTITASLTGNVTGNVVGNLTGNVTGNISGTAPAGTLTGTTLAANVVISSLTTVGVLAAPHMTAAVIDSGGLTVTSGTSALQAVTATTGIFSSTLSTSALTSTGAATIAGMTVSHGGYGGGSAIPDTESTAVGTGALAANIYTSPTSGGRNAAFGHNAMIVNSTGFKNAAFGYESLYRNTSGSTGTAFGYASLVFNTIGIGNTAVGYQSGHNIDFGNYNTLVGFNAGIGEVVGAGTGFNGQYNTGVGYVTMLVISTGTNNSSLGSNTLSSLTSGNLSTAIGANALASVITSSGNTAVGANALYATLGFSNVALGYFAGRYETGSQRLIIDNQDRTNSAGEVAGAMFYGVFNGTPASQTLRINAVVTMPYALGVSGLLTANAGVTVTAGTTAVQALTATTGNFSGAITGALTGNATTATALATARTIGITGDITYTSPAFDGSGNVTAAATLATVNSNVGSFGSSTAIPVFTVNGKGLITAASTAVVVAPAGTLSGATLAANVLASSLTSVGILVSPHFTGAVVDSGGFTVTSGTTALQAVTATTGVFTTSVTVNSITLSRGGGSDPDSTALGAGALAANVYVPSTTGYRNTAVGYSTLNANTDGYKSTALGYSALSVNTTGYQNTALGYASMVNNLTGFANTSVGYQSAHNQVSGSQNVFIGYNAGLGTAASGSNNVAIGPSAMNAWTSASNNVIIGYAAGFAITSSGGNIAIGQNALAAATTLGTNTAVGTNSLLSAAGFSNVALGYYAGAYETGSQSFYVDNQNRTNTAGDKAGALLYGTFNATPASQTLKINAVLTVSYATTISTGGLTVSAGTTAIQALTATTGVFSGSGQFGGTLTVTTGGVTATGNSTITGTLGGITTLTATTHVWGGAGSQITEASNGTLTLKDAAGTAFTGLQWGGTSSLFPMLKRSGTQLQVRLADDSNYASFNASYLTFGGASFMTAPSDGVITMANIGYTSFTRLNFGGTTTSFAAFATSGTAISTVRADGSAGGSFKVTGTFGCNNATPQAAYASGGALGAYATGTFGFTTEPQAAALYAMVVSIRAALVANGIMS